MSPSSTWSRFLNIRGADDLMDACRHCFASLFTDRAISYRIDNSFDHFKVALSVAVMKMVRSDLAASGVIFTLGAIVARLLAGRAVYHRRLCADG
jgi:phosphoenolpyruvate synthase/pyruvate phosphate dikinase